MSDVMVLVGGAFGECFNHEDGALMDGLSALIQEAPESSLAPLPREDHQTPAAQRAPHLAQLH